MLFIANHQPADHYRRGGQLNFQSRRAEHQLDFQIRRAEHQLDFQIRRAADYHQGGREPDFQIHLVHFDIL